MRANALGYLSTNQYSYLMRQMSTKGYRQTEPLDDLIEYRHPRALKQTVKLLLTKGNMSAEDILGLFVTNRFSISANVIEELLDLEKGTLSKSNDGENKIIEFPILKS